MPNRATAPAAPRAPACDRPAPTARWRRRRATSIRPARCARGSKSIVAPSPWQSAHAPCGELNENARGVISGMLDAAVHARQLAARTADRRRRNVLITTMSSARLSAVSTDSVSRRSMPPRTISRSTTTSMVWLRRRSSLMSSSSERNWPSIRALVNPRARSPASSFLNSPFRPRTSGASTLMRSSCGYSITMSTMRSSDWLVISLPQFGAVRHADVGEQQPQVVVDLGDRADRRARVRPGGLLLDRDGRREAVDQIDVRLLHLLEELPGVGGQRLDVPPLALGVDGVEGERRLARARQAGDDHQLVPRDVDVDVLEVVDAGAAYRRSSREPLLLKTPPRPETSILQRAPVDTARNHMSLRKTD